MESLRRTRWWKHVWSARARDFRIKLGMEIQCLYSSFYGGTGGQGDSSTLLTLYNSHIKRSNAL